MKLLIRLFAEYVLKLFNSQKCYRVFTVSALAVWKVMCQRIPRTRKLLALYVTLALIYPRMV